MGHQESLVSVDCIAEVAGIDQVVRESEEVKTLDGLAAIAQRVRDVTCTGVVGLEDLYPTCLNPHSLS